MLIIEVKLNLQMKLITWFFSFIAVLGAEAWFLQPNKPWTFEWEPLLLLIASIGIFLSIERGLFKHANPSDIELLKKEVWLIDYVIIHEMCHFYEPNHQAGFWALVAAACPKYKEAKKALKE